MPDLGPLHPQVVHFVVALGIAGVVLRLISLTGKLTWTRPAGAALLIVAAGASVVAAMSGSDAHGPVERIPGAREAVEEHERLGEQTRNIFLAVAALEVVALLLARREKVQRGLYIASGLAGIAACWVLYEAGEHGGKIVYSYAGGVGMRSGDPADVQHLLVAGLYQGAQAARDAGRPEEAVRLTDELARQLPSDPSVKMLSVRSMIEDRKDPRGALAALAAMPDQPDDMRFMMQKGLMQSEALAAAGQRDSARAVLVELEKKIPRAKRFVDEAMAKLK